MKKIAPTFATMVAILLFSLAKFAVASEPVDFSNDIQPIFAKHCIQCHGPEEQNGGMRLDQKRTVFSEADSGHRAIVANNVEESELVKRVQSSDPDNQMPPEGERLTTKQLDLLERWIADGALWPDKAIDTANHSDATSTHWSFLPIESPNPPVVRDIEWSWNEIDRFLQSKREASGLIASDDSDLRALIRRATYDLTGLPPTPDEVSEFLIEAQTAIGKKEAIEKLVDRLLSHASYGERWGRHWMDWVRYADTSGDNSDYPIPEAYLYRNYIIESFNADLPYDRFLIEQIAGDLLPSESLAQKNRQTIATGYLAMARRFGSLVERYPWHLTIEDTIDNLGKTVLGLTLACARCHDHKFDPISTRDYYGIYGIFASTQYPMPGLELFKAQRDFVPLIPSDEVADVMQPFQKEIDNLETELETLLAKCETQSIEDAAVSSQATIEEQRKRRKDLDTMMLKARKAGEKLAEALKKAPAIPTAYAVQDGRIQDARIQIKGEPDRPGAAVPRKFPDVLGAFALPEDVEASSSGRLQLANWIASGKNPLTARVIVNRVWQRHFGVGLVASTSDFGLRGELPSHPELLDWLANDFMQSGWSIKHLHRRIMTSRTYQLSSRDSKANIAIDPTNRLYWKFNRLRLDAESIRDTLLVLGDSLDPNPMTEPHPFPEKTKWDFTQHYPFKDDYASQKRSVYMMTKRLTAKVYFQTFDGPDPNVCTSDRDQSVTPLQALYFVNDAFLHDQANRFADRVTEGSASDQQRLNYAFDHILCRIPTDEESQMMLEHLKNVREQLVESNRVELEIERQAWSSLTRSLLRLNEFLYLD